MHTTKEDVHYQTCPLPTPPQRTSYHHLGGCSDDHQKYETAASGPVPPSVSWPPSPLLTQPSPLENRVVQHQGAGSTGQNALWSSTKVRGTTSSAGPPGGFEPVCHLLCKPKKVGTVEAKHNEDERRRREIACEHKTPSGFVRPVELFFKRRGSKARRRCSRRLIVQQEQRLLSSVVVTTASRLVLRT